MDITTAKENGIILGSEFAFDIKGLVGIAKTTNGIEYFYIGLTIITKYDSIEERNTQYDKAVELWIETKNYFRNKL